MQLEAILLSRMHLLSWHGTIACLPEQSGTIRLRALPLEADATPALEVAPEHLADQAFGRHPALGDIRAQAARHPHAVHLLRDGFFMCADANTRTLVFNRAAANEWETFLPIGARDFADLNHILRHRWINRATREVAPRTSLRLTEGFWLRIGAAALDLATALPLAVPERGQDGLPRRLILPHRAGDIDLVIAEPRSSALLNTALWPVRARRVAELIAIAVHRHLRGLEPTQEELERDAGFLEAHNGAAGLEELLEHLVPNARAALSMTASGDDIALHAGDVDDKLAAARKHIERAQTSLAMAALERVTAVYPEDARAWFILGQMRQEAGDYAAAAGAWERCLAIEPGQNDAIANLAAMAGSLARPLEAASRFEAALERAPNKAELRVLLADRYADLGWLDRAAAQFQRIDEVLSGWMEASRRNTLRALERQIAALSALEERNLQTGGLLSSNELMQKARSGFMSGDLATCNDAIDALLAQDSSQLQPHLLRAELLVRESGLSDAIAYLESLNGIFGRDPTFIVTQARWLQAACSYTQAETVLSGLVRYRPRDDAYRLLAINALCRDDVAALGRVTRAWQAFATGSTAAGTFAIAEARATGRVVRLDSISAEAPAPQARIMQFWNTPEIPSDVAATMASWPQLNPGMEHLVFDYQEARAFLDRHCAPSVLSCYESAHHPAMQSDIFRLAFLSVDGGVYVDADEFCTHDMRRVFAALSVVDLVAVQSTQTPPYIHNSFIAARAGCSIIKDALSEAVRIVGQHVARGAKPDIWHATGPGVLTRAIGRFVADTDNKARVMLLTDSEYRAFSHTKELRYKRTSEGDWRLN